MPYKTAIRQLSNVRHLRQNKGKQENTFPNFSGVYLQYFHWYPCPCLLLRDTAGGALEPFWKTADGL